MNTVQSDKIDNDFINKTDALSRDKRMLILVLSENQYLIGFFQGYSHAAGCKIKTLPLCSFDNFFEIIIKESSSVLFIDMTWLEQFSRSQGWAAAWLIIRHNKITLCGIGKQAPNNDKTLPQSVFNKIFTEPFSLKKNTAFSGRYNNI